jgi:hypothetical protein
MLWRVAGHVNEFGSRYFSFSYSALACFRMGMSGSASFQRAKERSLQQSHPAQQVGVARVGAYPVPERVYGEKGHASRMRSVPLFE